MRSLALDGIILRKRPRGENDQFVTLYSPVLGKVDAVAKGARKIDSSFTGHLEPLNICRFQLYRSARGFTITQCQARQTFRVLRDNLEKSLLATMILEIFQKSAYTDEHGQELFALLDSTLNHLGASRKHLIVIESFKIKLLQLLGAMPDMTRCSFCQKKWTASSEILLDSEGHFTCAKCSIHGKEHFRAPFPIIKLLNFLGGEDLKQIEKITLREEEKNTLKKISSLFLQHYLNSQICSERILAQIAS